MEENNNVNLAEEKEQNSGVDYAAELEKLRAENDKLKKAQTNASADASKWKKELQARMTEDEKAKAEQAEATAAMQKELESLRKEKTISEHTANFLSVGFDETLAKSSAQAIVEGDFEKMFDDIKAFVVSHDKAIAADAVRKTPVPTSGNSQATVSKEQFNNMNYREMVEFKNNHPDEYEKFMKREN